MKTPLAWKNIVHNRKRSALGLAGVGFASILIFMQMGFLGAIQKTATQTYDALQFDLMLCSPAYLHLTEPRSFPERRLLQATAVSGIARARPFYIGLSEWQTPPRDQETGPLSWLFGQLAKDGERRGIITMGVDPSDAPYVSPQINNKARQLTNSHFVLLDSESKPEYGTATAERMHAEGEQLRTALGTNQVQVVDLFKLGTGMACNGACMTNVMGYRAACPWQPEGHVTLGLLTLDDPATAIDVKQQLERVFGIRGDEAALRTQHHVDVAVLTKAEVTAREMDRWLRQTPFGIIFTAGVAVAAVVGAVVVYQVLSNDIASMISEYATLRAMGYRRRDLLAIVLLQAVLLAILGYLASLVISIGLYALVGSIAGIPMVMTGIIMGCVFIGTVSICVAAASFAMVKLFVADPASLF